MEEIWKFVEGYDGIYQVSNLGKVKSSYYSKEKVLKPRKNGDGYLSVILKGKKQYIHRLVAQAFIQNPNHYPIVNHKDEIKYNNCADNLEWCSQKYNMNYGTIIEKTGKKIIQYDKFMNKINEYKSISEASRKCNVKISSISAVCRKKRKTAGNYIWKFKEEQEIKE